MQSKAQTVDDYIKEVPADRQEAISKLRAICLKELKGSQEMMGYGMMGYAVPFSLYPKGYHCDPKLPLPFVSIASQKNFIALYHMGIYANPALLNWFVNEYPKHSKTKLDMGKSCIRFKNPKEIPFALIQTLLSKMSVKDWIKLYEETFIKPSKK